MALEKSEASEEIIIKKLKELGTLLEHNPTLKEVLISTTSQERDKRNSSPYLLHGIFDYRIIIIIILIVTVAFVLHCLLLYKDLFFPQSSWTIKQLNNAIQKNDTLRALSLLDPGLVNKVVNADGYTPFLVACFYGQTMLVKAMLLMGANVNARTIHGENAFYLACFHCVCNVTSKDASCIHTLYYAGADIDMKTSKNITALQLAAINGHTRLVKWLIDKGASLNVRPSLKEIASRNSYSQLSTLVAELIEEDE